MGFAEPGSPSLAAGALQHIESHVAAVSGEKETFGTGSNSSIIARQINTTTFSPGDVLTRRKAAARLAVEKPGGPISGGICKSHIKEPGCMKCLALQWGTLGSHNLLFLPFKSQWGFTPSLKRCFPLSRDAPLQTQGQRDADVLCQGCSGGRWQQPQGPHRLRERVNVHTRRGAVRVIH